ncbi:MAG: tetratricopeptide repeat protein, partial [Methylococcaceae bacterium]|nr:tetratricopeptide repeat protein [Methylococcaceae bacterium]
MGSETTSADFDRKLKAFKGSEFERAELYFNERRFIEAAHLFSKILDRDPKYPQARNLLARCFYFLGNPDRSLAELDLILSKPGGQMEDWLDALFLTGAVVLESHSSPKLLKKGISAWENYLKITPRSELAPQVKEG